MNTIDIGDPAPPTTADNNININNIGVTTPTTTADTIIPPPRNTNTSDESRGGDTNNSDESGGGDIRAPGEFSLPNLFAELDLLRSQASAYQMQAVNFQEQLDKHRTVLTRSVASFESSLQTLRDASNSQYNMANRAMDIAQESYNKVLECKSATSALTLQFHNVTSSVDRFMEKYQAPPPRDKDTNPHSSDSVQDSVEAAFQAADAALSDGISEMERVLGSSLDRNINARLDAASGNVRVDREPRVGRFSEVTYCPRSTAAYDSDAAYAAAHPEPTTEDTTASPTHADNADSTQTVRSTGGGTTLPNAFGDGLSPRYNGPNSPRHRHALMRGCSPNVLLWHAGGKLGDPVCGCDFMEAEDVEALEISPHLAVGIAEDHYGIVEGWDNPRWSQKDIRDFHGTYEGYRAPSTGGPHPADILKQISSWEKLSDLTPTGWQAFYNRLRRFSFKWNIALMPFEAINLKYECHGHALCTCGLGLARWKRMGDALFLVLEYLLPTTNSIISTNLDALANGPSSANGYELLWILLKEFIPMFDRSRPAIFPTWTDSEDIFQFARMLLMYCTLSQHRGPPYSEAMKSRMFLSNVRGRYTTLAAQYSAMVGTYCPGRDGVVRCSDPLPHHLTVMELARTFFDEAGASTSTQTVPLPSIQAFHTTTSSPPPSLQPTTPVSSITDESRQMCLQHPSPAPMTTRPTHIQGYVANAVTRSQSNRRNRTAPDPTSREKRPPLYPRHEAPCEACGKYGHPATRCDMLAMAVWLLRYFKDKSNADAMAAAETRWVDRNKKFLPRDDRTPRTILANYCAEMEFTTDKVEDELDWDFLSASAGEDNVEE